MKILAVEKFVSSYDCLTPPQADRVLLKIEDQSKSIVERLRIISCSQLRNGICFEFQPRSTIKSMKTNGICLPGVRPRFCHHWGGPSARTQKHSEMAIQNGRGRMGPSLPFSETNKSTTCGNIESCPRSQGLPDQALRWLNISAPARREAAHNLPCSLRIHSFIVDPGVAHYRLIHAVPGLAMIRFNPDAYKINESPGTVSLQEG